jgi:ribosomal protein S18 acetylase RimI-like enzyme
VFKFLSPGNNKKKVIELELIIRMSNRRELKITTHKIIYDGILRKISRVLSHIGIAFKFYYIFKEGLSEIKEDKLNFSDYEIRFLDYKDITTLHNLEGHDNPVSAMLDRLRKGDKCLGLKNNGKIVGFTWSRFDQFAYPSNFGFSLGPDEAYLYDMYVLKEYRGRNIAPLLRYSSYQELAKIGRTVLYSVSLIPNTPAIRFKKKLGAQIQSLWLYVRLNKKISWNWKLKTYK